MPGRRRSLNCLLRRGVAQKWFDCQFEGRQQFLTLDTFHCPPRARSNGAPVQWNRQPSRRTGVKPRGKTGPAPRLLNHIGEEAQTFGKWDSRILAPTAAARLSAAAAFTPRVAFDQVPSEESDSGAPVEPVKLYHHHHCLSICRCRCRRFHLLRHLARICP